MKILLANKFYYARGGDCVYTMQLERLLLARGHEVAVYAMQYPNNVPSRWESYWPSAMTSLQALTRPFGDAEVRRTFTALLDDFRPDVVHLQNVHTQLSPLLAELAHRRGIGVCWTLHDPKPVCPSHVCTRGGELCTDCFSHPLSVVRHRCMQRGGILGSFIGYLEARKWSVERLERATDCFISPSLFLRSLLLRGGCSPHKVTVLPNFIPDDRLLPIASDRCPHYIYVGRLSHEKGVETLCRAASRLPYRLVVVGDGELFEPLRAKYGEVVDFRGRLNWVQFAPLLASARFSVIPSECAENNPLAAIESLVLGTPVLGADVGGIPELVLPPGLPANGMTFRSADVDKLVQAIRSMWETIFDYQAVADRARRQFAAHVHAERLEQLYLQVSASAMQ